MSYVDSVFEAMAAAGVPGAGVVVGAARLTGSTPSALIGAVGTGFNQGLVSMAGTAVNAFYNAPNMVTGVVETALGRPDLAPNLVEGTELVSSALKNIGLGSMIAEPVGDPAATFVYKATSLATGFLVPDAEFGGVGDAALGPLANASKAVSCPTCIATELKALEADAEGIANAGREWIKDAVSHGLDFVNDLVTDKKKDGAGSE